MTLYLTRTPRRLPAHRARLFDAPFFNSPLHRELDRVFDALWAETFHGPTRTPEAPVAPVAIDEDDEALHVRVGLDGFTEDDVEVSLLEDVLEVTGDTDRTASTVDTDEAADNADVDGEAVHAERHERRTFRRAWRVPTESYDLEGVAARVEDGALHLTVPRAKAPEPRRIPIGR